MEEFLTPSQVARAIGVSDASLKRWCDRGVLPSVRTAGGHRRLPLSGVVQFLRLSGHPLVRPQILGLPPTTGSGRTIVERACLQARSALELGDHEQFQRVIFDLYLAGYNVCDIGDRVVAPAFREIGSRWQHGQTDVYQERRAIDLCTRTLHRLQWMLDPPTTDAPRAIGGAPEGDPYGLPTLLAELVLREAGWQAQSFGSNLPLTSLAAALRLDPPRMVWLSVSFVPDIERFLADYAEFMRVATELNVSVVCGGRFLSDSVRQRMRFHAYGDSLDHLSTSARSFYNPKRSSCTAQSQAALERLALHGARSDEAVTE